MIPHFYQSIPGWFDYLDVYQSAVADATDGAHFVEVGCWQGQSTAGMAVEIANSGKQITFDVVDWFKGSPNEMGPHHHTFPSALRAEFEKHTEPVAQYIASVHAMASVDAAKLYADESLDFVWVDASHDAESVLADLSAWWPKVKRGGVMAGHDLDWATVQQALVPWAQFAGVTPEHVSARSWSIRRPVLYVPKVGPRKCLVAVASNERTIYRQTVESLLALGWGARVTKAAAAHGFDDVAFTWSSRHVRVDDLRNEAVLRAQAIGASHVLFLDADNTWPTDVLDRMLRHHDRGIVAGLYFLKGWPNNAVAFEDGRVNLTTGQVDYTYDEPLASDPDVLRPEVLVGMGCTLIPMGLFEVMERPWFEYRQDANGVWSITEDVAFCQKARAHGCPIFLDPSVVCGHINSEHITESHAMRSAVELAKLNQIAHKPAPTPVAVPA